MRDRDRRNVERLPLLTTQVIRFDLYCSWGDPYYSTPPSMNGSLRLRAMIARRVLERAGNRRADGIAAIVMRAVQAVISVAIV
jgi:hypothetical protein